ncbi:MAG: thermonuclease family protein [Pseudomonadota bacterium]
MNGVLWLASMALVTFMIASGVRAETVSGPARLVDGDTLEVGGQMVRLFGIDAPETRQTCTSFSGKSFACGTKATEALARLIGQSRVTCEGEERDSYDRLIGWCRAGGRDTNREMVRLGWAVAFRRYSDLYLAEELEAAKSGAGLWRGEFQRPSEFRAAIWAASEQEAPEGCPIKGNISSRGKIYHAPWSRSYSRTRINPARGERWFCSEAEALAAGWRAPLR